MEQNSKQTSKGNASVDVRNASVSHQPFFALVTYRIPLIDLDTLDLLPIHFLTDPGLDFQWPTEEELPDDKIQQYTHYGSSRMEILEKYLSLSREVLPLTQLIPSATIATEDTIPTVDSPASPSAEIEPANGSHPVIIPVPNKKPSRPSLNSFSKIIRRTFMQPFSSSKRHSLKHQSRELSRQSSTLTADASVANENTYERRKSSPLLNHRTNILTIIVTNFQPKRPKTSDNMIRNYIDACLNEYRLEMSGKQTNGASSHENENGRMMASLATTNGTSATKSSNSYPGIVVFRPLTKKGDVGSEFEYTPV